MAIELSDLEAVCREIGKVIDSAINRTYGKRAVGFTLLLFDFGEGGHMTYISNAERDGMLAAMREMMEKLGQ